MGKVFGKVAKLNMVINVLFMSFCFDASAADIQAFNVETSVFADNMQPVYDEFYYPKKDQDHMFIVSTEAANTKPIAFDVPVKNSQTYNITIFQDPKNELSLVFRAFRYGSGEMHWSATDRIKDAGTMGMNTWRDGQYIATRTFGAEQDNSPGNVAKPGEGTKSFFCKHHYFTAPYHLDKNNMPKYDLARRNIIVMEGGGEKQSAEFAQDWQPDEGAVEAPDLRKKNSAGVPINKNEPLGFAISQKRDHVVYYKWMKDFRNQRLVIAYKHSHADDTRLWKMVSVHRADFDVRSKYISFISVIDDVASVPGNRMGRGAALECWEKSDGEQNKEAPERRSRFPYPVAMNE